MNIREVIPGWKKPSCDYFLLDQPGKASYRLVLCEPQNLGDCLTGCFLLALTAALLTRWHQNLGSFSTLPGSLEWSECPLELALCPNLISNCFCSVISDSHKNSPKGSGYLSSLLEDSQIHLRCPLHPPVLQPPGGAKNWTPWLYLKLPFSSSYLSSQQKQGQGRREEWVMLPLLPNQWLALWVLHFLLSALAINLQGMISELKSQTKPTT